MDVNVKKTETCVKNNIYNDDLLRPLTNNVNLNSSHRHNIG